MSTEASVPDRALEGILASQVRAAIEANEGDRKWPDAAVEAVVLVVQNALKAYRAARDPALQQAEAALARITAERDALTGEVAVLRSRLSVAEGSHVR